MNKVVAQVKHKEENNLIYVLNDEHITSDLFESLKHIDGKCDVCKKSVYRKITYIVYDEENKNYIQCGKNCLDKVLPKEEIEEMENNKQRSRKNYEFGDDGFKIIYPTSSVNTKVLTYYAIKMYEEKNGFVKDELIDYSMSHRFEYDEAMEKRVDEVLDFIKKLEANNNFIYNLQAMVLDGVCDNAKIFQYVYKVYLDEMLKLQIKNKNYKESKYVGEIGEKVTFTLDLIKNKYTNYYSYNRWCDSEEVTQYYLQDVDGNLYSITTKKDIEKFVGKKVKATVKGYFDKRDGTKVTKLKLMALA